MRDELPRTGCPRAGEREVPARLARELQRAKTRSAQILVEHADRLTPMTSRGPITGYAATGTPQASASSWTTPNVSVRLGNTKTSAAAIRPASSAPLRRPRKVTSGKTPPQFRLLRAFADHDFRPGQIERKERFQILLDRDPACGEKDRTRQVKRDDAMRREQVGVDAARPHAEVLESAARSRFISDVVETIVTVAAAWKRRSTA